MSPSTVVLVVVTVVLTATGLAKLVAVAAMRERAAHLGYPVGAFRAVGALELAGVAGLWWGRRASEPLAVVAASGLLLLLVGAVASHLRAGDAPVQAAPAALVAGLVAALLVLGVSA